MHLRGPTLRVAAAAEDAKLTVLAATRHGNDVIPVSGFSGEPRWPQYEHHGWAAIAAFARL